MKKADVRPGPFVPDAVEVSRVPRKFKPEELPIGQPVWYRNERYYVESVPRSWNESTYIRIGNFRFHPEMLLVKPLPNDRHSFTVHPDLLEVAPVTKNRFGRQPTRHAVEQRKVQRETGQRDNGDEVAVMLRACKSLDDVYAAAAEYLEKSEKELRTKYGHLDNGRQRMCLGNIMRGEANRRKSK